MGVEWRGGATWVWSKDDEWRVSGVAFVRFLARVRALVWLFVVGAASLPAVLMAGGVMRCEARGQAQGSPVVARRGVRTMCEPYLRNPIDVAWRSRRVRFWRRPAAAGRLNSNESNCQLRDGSVLTSQRFIKHILNLIISRGYLAFSVRGVHSYCSAWSTILRQNTQPQPQLRNRTKNNS